MGVSLFKFDEVYRCAGSASAGAGSHGWPIGKQRVPAVRRRSNVRTVLRVPWMLAKAWKWMS